MTTPAIGRRRTASCLRTVVFLFLVTFVWLQLHVASLGSSRHGSEGGDLPTNDSTAAILSMVPQVLHKFLTPRPRNGSAPPNGTDPMGRAQTPALGLGSGKPNISDIRRSVERYNDAQTILNEDIFGPVQNDTLIVVVQVTKSRSNF